jgi:uncharacterized protein YbjQ (UPF0145 family)
MMDRPTIPYAIILLVTLTVALLPTFGCTSGLATAMYLLKGTDVDPDYAGLKGKKVAVVCRPVVTLQYRNSNVARDIGQMVTLLLQKKVPKIETIDQRKVAKWTDENTWEEFVEVGKAMKADMVVGIDLESFNLLQGQTLYQGTANATVRVFDCKKGGKMVFEKTLPQSVYPPNTSIPTSERQEVTFRQEFETVLADQIARHFYAHDPYADMAQDASSLR